jgi:hypothetical protein
VRRAVREHAASFAAVELLFDACVVVVAIVVEDTAIHPNFHSWLLSKSLDIGEQDSTGIGSVDQRPLFLIVSKPILLPSHEVLIHLLSFRCERSRLWLLVMSQFSWLLLSQYIVHALIRINITLLNEFHFLFSNIYLLIKAAQRDIKRGKYSPSNCSNPSSQQIPSA